ncbi:MAG: histone deacetylase [Bryobacteraceae bacterium]|nr:histone deacetylase [Bryobacteraceae bacterium]
MALQLVYHDAYDLHFGDHVFPSVKYKLVRRELLESAVILPTQIHQPEPASEEDMLLVHTPEWVKGLRKGTLSYMEILKLEIPYSRQVVDAFWLAAGGTILSARLALTNGVGFNIGGGFHHAFPAHGEGFCAINDIAVAIRRLQKDGAIERAMVIDADVHHGNGTAAIFAGDRSVFTLSIHQLNNYPELKPPSTLDIHLHDGVGDEEYVGRLREACELVIPAFRPDLIVYVAGADPYIDDQLGGLNLTVEGLRARDLAVFETALNNRVPVAVTLAGGYARQLADTVRIHAGTAIAAQQVMAGTGWA